MKPFQQDGELRDNAQPNKYHLRTFTHVKGAKEFLEVVSSKEEKTAKDITDLTLTINGTLWTDFEDDLWSMALNCFRPQSSKLEHLKIIIQGSVLFTETNLIKPLITTTSLPIKRRMIGDPESKKIHEVAEEDDNIQPGKDDKDEDEAKVPTGRMGLSEPARESVKEAAKIKERYTTRKMKPSEVLGFIGNKTIVDVLLSYQPIKRITLEGPFALDLRWKLLSHFVPDWRNDPHGAAQGGFTDEHAAHVMEIYQAEQELLFDETRYIRVGGENVKQDQEDLGKSLKNAEGLGFGMAETWKVPTGKEGRIVLGVSARRAWRGPLTAS